MPVLLVLRGLQLGRRYLLNEKSLVLGRSPGRADIVIEGDPQISGAHTRIHRGATTDEFLLQDLGSLNGTQVNGVPVKECRLHDGDKIFLGQTILKFTFHDPLEESFHGRIHQLMNLDELTGLPVLRAFEASLRGKLREGNLRGTPVSVLMMDMDGLKRINDTHGHQFGAFTISEAGKLIGRRVAVAGEASRFGGDEFVAYLAGVPKNEAVAVADEIRRMILEAGFCLEGIALNPTISIGVATCPEDGETLELLVRKADEALYRAKQGGRNSVSV